jgi:hypothetical protein
MHGKFIPPSKLERGHRRERKICVTVPCHMECILVSHHGMGSRLEKYVAMDKVTIMKYLPCVSGESNMMLGLASVFLVRLHNQLGANVGLNL